MDELTNKLNEHLERLMFDQKKSTGIILDDDDIGIIFETIKKYDKEMCPLIETVEKMIPHIEDDFSKKNFVKEILQFYNIIPNDNLMKTRHKLFFSESKQLIKKQYFTDVILEQIRTTFETYKIFDKVA